MDWVILQDSNYIRGDMNWHPNWETKHQEDEEAYVCFFIFLVKMASVSFIYCRLSGNFASKQFLQRLFRNFLSLTESKHTRFGPWWLWSTTTGWSTCRRTLRGTRGCWRPRSCVQPPDGLVGPLEICFMLYIYIYTWWVLWKFVICYLYGGSFRNILPKKDSIFE